MFRLDRIQSVALTSPPIALGASFSEMTSKPRAAGVSASAEGHTPTRGSLDRIMPPRHQTIHASIGVSPYKNQPTKLPAACAVTRNEPQNFFIGAASALAKAKAGNGRSSLSCAGIKTVRSELQVGLLQSAKALCTPSAAASQALHAQQRPRHINGNR